MKRFALPLLFAATAAQAAITGIVVDEMGKPIAGATIRAYAGADWRVRAGQIVSGNLDQPMIGSAQSAENGSFKVDVKGPIADLMIEAPGQQAHIDEAADGDDLNVVVLHPKPGRRVRLVSNGKPVANATFVSGPVVVHTDAQATIELPESTARTVIMHPDFAPAPAVAALDDGAVPRDVVLSRGVAIRGHVLNADGQPVPNATISVSGWPLAQSAADGTFTVAHAPASWRTIVATEGSRTGVATNIRAASYDIRLKPAALVTGTTVPGSRVVITRGTETDSADSAIADAQGKFTSGPLPAGRYTIRSFHRGYSVSSTDVTVQEGSHATRALAPKPLGIIRGRVVDEQKQPVAGAFVGFGMFAARLGLAMTGSNGEFAVRSLDRNIAGALVAMKAGYAAGSTGIVPANKGDVTITLPRGFPLQVRVIDRARKPVGGATLSVAAGPADDFQSRFEAACEQPLVASCRTTPDTGAINLRATEGPYMVRVSGQSLVSKMMPAQTITEKSSPLTLEVDRGVEVSGRVTYADGTPVTDGFLMARMLNGTSVRLESDGSFTLRNVSPGKIVLVAMIPARVESAPVEVEAPARGVVITIPTPARIEGRVTDKDTGQPVTDFQVGFSAREGRSMTAPPQSVHSDDGSYVLDPVSAGALQMQFAAAGYARGTLGNVTVEEGKTLRGVDIQLDKGGSIRGHVTAKGEPVSGVFVQSGDGRGPMMIGMNTSMTDENGDYLIDGIGAGDRTLQFTKQGFVNKRKNVTVERGKEMVADVELDSGVELAGRVVDKSGQPIAGARVSAMALGGGMGIRPVNTDASGAFTISALSDGRYNVTATKEGLVSGQATDVIVPATAPLTLTLDSGGTLSGRITGLTEAELAATDVSVNSKGTYAHSPANSDGTFTVRGVPDGHVAVMAFVRSGLHPRQSVPQGAEVVNGSAAPVQIDFNQGLTVTGHVTKNGAPVTLGSVSFSGKDSRGAPIGSDGTYQIDGLEAGDYTVAVFGQGGVLYRAKYTVASSTAYDIQMQGATVHGRVLDSSSGAPLSEATVMTTATKDNPTMRQATTDTDGNFTLDTISDGTIEIRAAHDQYAPAGQTVTLSGGNAPNVEIRLDAAQPTVFRITDAQTGTPLDAMINVNDGKKTVAQSRGVRDDDGGIRVYTGSGHFRASIFSRGYATQNVEFSAPGPDVRVALSLAGRLMLTASKTTHVLIRNTTPGSVVPGAGGIVTGVSRGATVTPSGTSIDSLNPGSYSIDVLGSTPNVVLKSIPVTIYAGQTTTVSVD